MGDEPVKSEMIENSDCPTPSTSSISDDEQGEDGSSLCSSDQQRPESDQSPVNNDDEDNDNNKYFEVGDHVYSWCSFLGIPRAYQHHGIVIDRDLSNEMVTILDFSCLVDGNENRLSAAGSGKMRSSTSWRSTSEIHDDELEQSAILREYTIDESIVKTVWRKVRYDATLMERWFWRAGTVSKATPDPVEMVLARAEFLARQHKESSSCLLSSYDLFQANCEHVAVWCKTGRFCSLQLSSVMAVGTALAAVPTVAVSQATTTISAAGLWGWLGYTTTVPLAVAVPWLIPATILGPAAAAGKTAFDRKRWEQTTDALNSSFREDQLMRTGGKCVVYRAVSNSTNGAQLYEKKAFPM